MSSSVSFTPTVVAIARRCNTALVDPPNAITVTSALRNAAGVIMSDGVIPSASSRRTAAPAARHSSNLAGEVAGVDDE